MPHYLVPEMHFGYRERFRYFECSECGCLQIVDFPSDVAKYYPPEYSSLTWAPSPPRGLRHVLQRVRDRYAVTGRGRLGKLLDRIFPYRFKGVGEWLSKSGANRDTRILDVGCGRGELLFSLGDFGYRHLVGVDPFIAEDISYPNGVRVLRKTIHELRGTFDLIMFHHSLEHIPNQWETLRSASRMLSPTGHCIIRVPTASSFAWEYYRDNWVQIDAPRHFFLHSTESLRLLGEQAGLTLREICYDSTEFQFTGSEMYLNGILLATNGKIFSRGEIRKFQQRAQVLNSLGRGDQATFYFGKASPDPQIRSVQ